MINLITGKPGNGKTLWTLAFVKQYAEKEGRPVFYANIKDLSLPWTEIEADKWYECPEGAIIVIDECQTLFRPRSIGKEPPKYVSELETHRHKGFDLFLITQHPMLADSAIRRLVGVHREVVRSFGLERATVHEWNTVKENCDKPAGRADSIKHFWRYPKEVYGYYKSATLHTVKRSIPVRLYLLVGCLVLFVCGFAYLGHYVRKQGAENQQVTVSGSSDGQQKGSQFSERKPASVRPVDDPIADAKHFVFENTPRVDGLPHTAPKYDEMTKPTEVPVPAACVKSSSGCRCYTQQGTKMDVQRDMCLDIVAHGFFEDFDRKKKRDRDDKEAVQVASAAPAAEAVAARSGAVVSFGEFPVKHGWEK